MRGELVYRGESYFREGEAFCIIQFPEAVKDRQKPHSHDFVEICYVYSGTGYHTIGEQEYEVSKGDLFLINYDMTHAFYRDPGDQELVTYNILFKPGFLDESLLPFHDFSSLTMSYLFKNQWDDDLVRSDLRLNAAEQREFDQLITKMDNEYHQRQDGYNAIIRAYMIELIVRIMRLFNQRGAGDVQQRKKASVIESAIQHLDKHYNEPVSLMDLARKSFVSKNYFCQLFKETTGQTVSQYTQQIRIDEACKQIVESNKTMNEIALDVGYTDYKAFYVTFKRLTGFSPNTYRNNGLK
ncbi:AraC family transcriptional regulator [Paenibacillus sp. strain BS8-2]